MINPRTVVAMVLAYVLPGAGHLYLGRRVRAVAFFCIVVVMFVLGIAIDGRVYTGGGGSLLGLLATVGTMGAGLPYFLAVALAGHGPLAGWNSAGDITSITFEHGTAFTITAGLMNLLLVLDTFDIAQGRKE